MSENNAALVNWKIQMKSRLVIYLFNFESQKNTQ